MQVRDVPKLEHTTLGNMSKNPVLIVNKKKIILVQFGAVLIHSIQDPDQIFYLKILMRGQRRYRKKCKIYA